MNQTPSDPALDVPWVTEPGVPAPGLPEAPPSRHQGRARTLALVGGILAIVGVAGVGGTLLYQKVSGGGPQPESVMPSSVIAFAKVDLDPSGGQKLGAIRFALKFPQQRVTLREDSDLREVVVKAMQQNGMLAGVDYQRDVAPWLGSRIGIGLLPGKGGSAQADPTPVIALAVTDKGAATASLPKVAASLHGQCRVLDAYAVCTGKGGDLATVVADASRSSLERSAPFSSDLGTLGENGIATAWADLGALSQTSPSLLPTQALGLDVGGGAKPTLSGRMAVALRFAGPNLELAGHVTGSSSAVVGAGAGAKDSGVTRLPKGTLAAIGVAGAGDRFAAAWPQLEKQLRTTLGDEAFSSTLVQLQDSLGITVPGELAKALGSQFVVSFDGMGADQSDPRIAVTSNGDRTVLQKLANGLGGQLGAGRLTVTPAGDRTVLAISEAYASAVATGSGLGATKTFEDAVPDAASAKVVAYADIAGILASFKDEIPADTAKSLAPLSAVGASVSSDGASADFRVRLTTR
jgi:hypothetical protein